MALAAIKGDLTLAQLAEQFDQSDHVVESPARGWSGRCFRSRRRQRVTQPAVDVKSLHAKIGALTLENAS